MPKALTPQERERIDTALRRAAEECISTLGIKRTTVDELVRRANIPKGTFYLFYSAKELLFARVLFDYHTQIKEKLLQKLRAAPRIDAESFTDIICEMTFDGVGAFFPQLMFSGELERLMRMLPEQMIIQHHKDDEAMMLEICAELPENAVKRIPEITPAFRLLFLSELYKREIGESEFDNTRRLLLRGLALQLFSEDV